MQVIECPNFPTDCITLTPFMSLVFLAGGITGCPDWQKEMIDRFRDQPDVVLLNPRRSNFNINDPAQSEEQIEWESLWLSKSYITLFWFPYQTMCPITLFELGVAAARGDRIVVGTHPAYARKFDVIKQLELLRPDVKVHDNFADVVEETLSMLITW